MRSRPAIREGLPVALLLATACINRGPGYSNGYENVNVDGTDAQAHVLPRSGTTAIRTISSATGTSTT